METKMKNKKQKLTKGINGSTGKGRDKSLETKEKICDTLMNKPYRKIIEKLNDIRRISSFQLKRLQDEKAINKDAVLRLALDIMSQRIEEIMEEKNKNGK